MLTVIKALPKPVSLLGFMKLGKTHIFIAVSSLALLVVVLIQWNSIVKNAKYKEEYFNEKASIVLAKTTEALSADKEISRVLQNGAGEKENKRIDSLLKLYTNYFNFHTTYTFSVTKSAPGTFPKTYSYAIGSSDNTSNILKPCYNKSLDSLAHINNWELRLSFPDQKAFILKEMGAPFIAAILLTLLVLILFWRTIISLIAEKRISEHTSDFLNNMTHEFKTPLASIALAGKMIMKEAALKSEDEIKDNSSIILQENEKLRLQIEQVLSISALESGEIPVQKVELDLHRLIQDCLASLDIQIKNRHANLKLSLEAERVVVMGDQTHLTNAIRNLIDNALKYSKEKPELTILSFNKEKNISLVISDKGIGIEKQYQKKVFDKYFRVPKGNLHDVRGFGLGLAYVKKIIELHGGKIGLQSEKDKGTTITIILPNE